MKIVTFLVVLAALGAGAYYGYPHVRPLLVRGPAPAAASAPPAGPAAPAAPAAPAPQVTETVVSHFGDTTRVFDAARGANRFPAAISPDWKHLALVRPVHAVGGAPSNGAQLYFDGAPTGTYPAIAVDSFTWSGDLSTYGYVATKSAAFPPRDVVVVGGREFSAGDLSSTGPLVLSHDGRRWAKARPSAVTPERLRRLVVDGQDVKLDADLTAVRFAPGDNRLVYQSGGRWFLENLPDQPYHALEDLLITSDGRTFIFYQPVGPDGDAAGNRLVVATPGSEPREYPGGSRPVLSPDGRRYAFVVARDGKARVVVDGDEGLAHDEVWAVGFSPDGTRVFYHAAESSPAATRYVLFLDGRLVASSTTEPTADPVFGDVAKSVAFWTDEGDKRLIQFNGRTVGDGPRTTLPLLAVSRDGQWLGVYADGDQPAVFGAAGQTWAGGNNPNGLFARPRPHVVVRRVSEVRTELNARTVQLAKLYVNDHLAATLDDVIFRQRGDGPWEPFHYDEKTRTVTAYGVRETKAVRVEVKLAPAS